MLCDVSADTFCILYLLSSIELSFVSLTFVFVCFRHNRNHYPFAAHIFGSEYCHIVVGTFKLQAQAPSAILASHMISMGAQSDVRPFLSVAAHCVTTLVHGLYSWMSTALAETSLGF